MKQKIRTGLLHTILVAFLLVILAMVFNSCSKDDESVYSRIPSNWEKITSYNVESKLGSYGLGWRVEETKEIICEPGLTEFGGSYYSMEVQKHIPLPAGGISIWAYEDTSRPGYYYVNIKYPQRLPRTNVAIYIIR